MTGAIKRVTTNFKLGIPFFDAPNWGASFERNMNIIDAVLSTAGVVSGIIGPWENNTAYGVDDRVVDMTNNTVWQCAVAHTSGSGTFAQDRAANPTYWDPVNTSIVVREAFQPGADYFVGDFVYDNSEFLSGVVLSPFTGGANLRDNIANIGVIVDFGGSGFASLAGGNTFTGTQTFTDAAVFNGAVTLNGAITLGQPTIARSIADGNVAISGGTTGSLGANIELYGESHASQANNAFIDADTTTFRAAAGGASRMILDGAQLSVILPAQITGGYSGGAIAGLTGGTTGGGLIQGQDSAHLVVGLKDNDGGDSFSIVSGGGNFMTDGIYDTLIAKFMADATVLFPNKLHITANGSTFVGTGTTAYNAATVGAQVGDNTTLLIHNNQDNNGAFSQIVLRQRATSQTHIRLVATGGTTPAFAVTTDDVERMRVVGTSVLIGATAGWNNGDGGSERGINLTTNGGLITSNDSLPTANFRRRGTAGRLVNFYDDGTTSGGVDVSGATATFVGTSDETWKDFIGIYDPLKAIDLIRRDPVRDFHWREGCGGRSGGEYGVGWGAQTSYEINPEFASVGGWFNDDGPCEPDDPGAHYQPWGIALTARIPYLWATTGWLLDERDALVAKNQELETRLDDIEARLAALETA